jgi:hypothetical protein
MSSLSGDTTTATKPVNGTNTGSPITRCIHPDNLGSTNMVLDESGNVVF